MKIEDNCFIQNHRCVFNSLLLKMNVYDAYSERKKVIYHAEKVM